MSILRQVSRSIEMRIKRCCGLERLLSNGGAIGTPPRVFARAVSSDQISNVRGSARRRLYTNSAFR